MADEQPSGSPPSPPSFWSKIRQWVKAQRLKLPALQALPNRLLDGGRSVLQKTKAIDWKTLATRLQQSISRLWASLKAFSWTRENIVSTVKTGRERLTQFLRSDKVQQQKELLRSRAKGIGDKALELKDKAQPLARQAQEKFGQTRLALTEGREASDGQNPQTPVWESRSGLPDWMERALLYVARYPWMRQLIDWWMGLKIWQSDNLFFRFLLPFLSFSSIALLLMGLVLHLYIRGSLHDTEDDLRVEASASLTEEIHQKYANYVIERSTELEHIVLDNVTKTAIVADAPTFQELNIQKMEEFSRSLLRKDSNLLNVLVLTKDEVKQAIRTRRIGDTTRFLFTCCELPPERQIHYDEINEARWLAELSQEKSGISDIYVSSVNGEKYFYHASNIEDFKGSQTGGLMLRYNLNFAIRTLQKSFRTGINFLVANDSVVVASSQDTLLPRIPVLGANDSVARPVDYIIAVINIIRRSENQAEALEALRRGEFIRNAKAFQQQLGEVLPGELSALSRVDSSGQAYVLTSEQAQAILDLSFGQLLGLKRRQKQPNENVPQLSVEESQLLAMAYLDSMQVVGTGLIVDEGYLLSFATNRFGWMIINQSTNEQYMAPIIAKNEFIANRFDRITTGIFWFVLFAGLFFLLVFLLLSTGILYRFTIPINQLVQAVAETRKASGRIDIPSSTEDELQYLGDSFEELSQDLKTYITKLEASNQELEQYAHVVAHDLREPLRMVSSYVGLLSRKHQQDFDKDSEEYVHFAIEGTKRMDLMIRHILDYATLPQKLNEEKVSEVDLNQQLQAAIDMLKPRLDEAEAKLEIADLPTANCKENYITQVFQNLLENALKYRQPERKLEVNISAQSLGYMWEISVADNGRGVPLEGQEKIFEMFTRWNENKDSESAGIGLATCRKIIEHNGGKIWVESQGEGRGATFKFSLPAAPLPEPEVDPES